MKRLLPLVGLLAIPTIALAIDFTDATSRYIDAPFPRAESVAISVLTNAGAVQGNPNGAFDADRALNRAEFLKIVLISSGKIDQEAGANCFPDVRITDWFAVYVCGGKDRGVVQGNPDGLFHPERPVNYAEALTMLVRLYRYDLTPQEGDPWYMVYARAANEHKTALPIALEYDEPLTRGQMARLAAAFLAEKDGKLSEYRQLELGSRVSSKSSSSTSSGSGSSLSSSRSSGSGASVSSSSSSTSSQSSSSSSSVAWFPTQSMFLIAGTKTTPIIDGTFQINDEDGILRMVEFTFRQEVKSVQSLILVDQNKTELATLILDTDNNDDHRKWKVFVLGSNGWRIPKNTPTQLGLIAVMKGFGTGAASNELVDRESFVVRVEGATTGQTKQLVPQSEHYPLHQTALGRISAIRNAGSGSAVVAKGAKKYLGKFSFQGSAVNGASVNLESIQFIVNATDVSITNVKIGGASEIQQASCTIERTDVVTVDCPVIPASLSTAGTSPTMLMLYGDLDLRTGVQSGQLQLQFLGTGRIGVNGSVRWTDGVGHFNWLESTVPMENGTRWTVNN